MPIQLSNSVWLARNAFSVASVAFYLVQFILMICNERYQKVCEIRDP
jgi:hypothetical protein